MNKLTKSAIVLSIFGIGWYILVNNNEPVEGKRAANVKDSLPQDSIYKQVKIDSLKKIKN